MHSLFKKPYIRFEKGERNLTLVDKDRCAPICAGKADYPGVSRAIADLSADFARVSGKSPRIVEDWEFSAPTETKTGASGTDPREAREIVVIGTLGRHALLDRLVGEKRLDVSKIQGKWEAYLIETIEAPLEGIDRALVIAGSDKRGTIYGIYDLSESIGVSPWYWWADSVPVGRESIYASPDAGRCSWPTVRYRGLFLNDEYPALTRWVAEKFGMAKVGTEPPVPEGVANYGREFYARLFELILRLRGNYLWPAMWNNAFHEDDAENTHLADEYGIVMGTSHQEPMTRAQKEWDRRYGATLGHWDWRRHGDILKDFWREGIRRNRAYESVVTLGLRGADDTPMNRLSPRKNYRTLEEIVRVQRGIIAEETGQEPEKTPQIWCLYKETQGYYELGMQVPDDVTLLWSDDNWGNLRRLPTEKERSRAGGAGIYYHFDYHGGPRSYQWINANPIAKVRDQMSLARRYGADRVWIVNVGHLKGYEFPLEYFLDLAWDTDELSALPTGEYTRRWAAREFGAENAEESAGVIEGYTRINGRRKPELLARDTYSLTNYREAERVVGEYQDLSAQASRVLRAVEGKNGNAFWQLVWFPVRACAIVHELYREAGKNALYDEQGRASANRAKERTEALFAEDLALMEFWNSKFMDGKWAHFMDQAHLGYTSWNDPPENSLRALPLRSIAVGREASLGAVAEGTRRADSGDLPLFDSIANAEHRIEIFNRGREGFTCAIETSAPWIRIDGKTAFQSRGVEMTIGSEDVAVSVSVDWDALAPGLHEGEVIARGAGRTARFGVRARKVDPELARAHVGAFESDGVVSIEATHYASKTDGNGGQRWEPLPGYGRTGSGMRAYAEADAQEAKPGENAPCLEYRALFHTEGQCEAHTYWSPILNFAPNRPVRYAISIDDGKPETRELVPAGYCAEHENRDWAEAVSRGIREGIVPLRVPSAGYHSIRVWMVDPGPVLEKIVIDLGGLRDSYLGPPETFRA